jgi:hypothetical protein
MKEDNKNKQQNFFFHIILVYSLRNTNQKAYPSLSGNDFFAGQNSQSAKASSNIKKNNKRFPPYYYAKTPIVIFFVRLSNG